MKTMSLKLPPALEEELESAVRRHRTTKSEVVRRALEQFLRGERPQHVGPSILDRAADLVGCVEGPEDLSSNETHLEGYGR